MANKGSPYEREMAKRFSLWLSDGEHDDWVWRTSTSGARATSRAKKGKDTAASHGDLTHLDVRGAAFTGKVCVECKRGYRTWSIMDVIDRKNAQTPQVFDRMWEQVTNDASFDNRHPLLCFRKDKRRSCVVIRKDFKVLIEDRCGSFKKDCLRLSYRKEVLYLMTLEDFLSWCDPLIFNGK